ncbi:MAG: hypothetical protein RIQ99_549 [Pseudomonadota bacterium]|jgi:hypothetical protein
MRKLAGLFGFQDMVEARLPLPLVWLGLSGLAPQALCLGLVALSIKGGGAGLWVGLAAGCFYAALILSFLGGMWWMAGLLSGETRAGLYVLAVLPSLAGWGALLPWVLGWHWPVPSLAVLGLLLLASPLADAAIARRIAFPRGWLALRVVMATGLGALTLALALAASIVR